MSGWDSLLTSRKQGFEGTGAVIEPELESIFSLGLVQFSLPSQLHSLSCASNVLFLTVIGQPRPGSSGILPQLIRIDLSKPTEVENIDLAIPPPTLSRDGALITTLNKVHVDPTGRHVIISTNSGENFYLFAGLLPPGSSTPNSNRKVRPLNKLKGAVIEAVSWSATSSTSSFSTKEILLGTRGGQVLETVLVDSALSESSSFSINVPGRSGATEKYVKLLYTIPERQAISGIKCELWGRRVAVIISTKTRIYQFLGNTSSGRRGEEESGMLESAFKPYVSGDVQPKSLELPGEPPNSELHFYATSRIGSDGVPTGMMLPKSIAWLTGPGIYHGSLTFPSPSVDKLHPGDGIIESASLIPYPAEPSFPRPRGQYRGDLQDLEDENGRTEMPISMALTEWHFVLLYEDKVRVIAILNDKVVFEERLELGSNEYPIKISTDLLRKTHWIHTNQSIFELVINDEDREVWKIYLDRSNWTESLKHAKTIEQRNVVNGAQADAFFAAGRYIQSAQHYALSSKSFEQVVLSFVDKDERDALRYYLVAKLERLKKTDLTQRMMLATWLIETYLAKINELEDIAAAERASEDAGNYLAEKVMIEDDLKLFLRTYRENLDSKTIFDLIASHGRDNLTLYFASVIGDHGKIINHWILEGDWKSALIALGSQESLELYYQYAPILIKKSPKLCVEHFLKVPSLDVRRLIPAFALPRSSLPLGTLVEDPATQIISYLRYSILQLFNTDTSVHNTLLTLYACSNSKDETDLLSFLNTCPDDSDTGKPHYDLDFALRLFKKKQKYKACGFVYAKMELWEIGIDFALGLYEESRGEGAGDGSKEDLELAMILADKPYEDDVLRKRLWLKIAKFVVGKKNDIETAMKFLASTPLLKIEDILPFFPDFTIIDSFKSSILSALEDYSSHIESLKEDMNQATRSAELIKDDIEKLAERFVVVEPGEKCRACGDTLLLRQFYIFPCEHAFHADCLIKEVTQHLSPTALRRMLELQSQLSPAIHKSSHPRKGSTTNDLLDFTNGTTSGTRKIANASVQGLDQLRKLVLPDALISIIGSALPNSTTLSLPNSPFPFSSSKGTEIEPEIRETRKEMEEKERLARMRKALDDLVAKSCVLCEGGINSIDRSFLLDGEGEM